MADEKEFPPGLQGPSLRRKNENLDLLRKQYDKYIIMMRVRHQKSRIWMWPTRSWSSSGSPIDHRSRDRVVRRAKDSPHLRRHELAAPSGWACPLQQITPLTDAKSR